MRTRISILIVGVMFLAGCGHTPTPRPWTTGEKMTLGWSVLASAADAYTTTQALNNPYNYEVNPLMGKHPSDGKVVIFLGVSQLVAIALAHWYPDVEFPLIGKVNMRYGFLGTKAVINTGCAINNYQLDWD